MLLGVRICVRESPTESRAPCCCKAIIRPAHASAAIQIRIARAWSRWRAHRRGGRQAARRA
eukprot:2969644-Pleurochrysis_carterae.AAC.7